MITFICCSIAPQMAESMRQSIEHTIGDVPFELIAFDNRELNYGICKVYNLCAERAKYDYLCFIHEDVIFNSTNWGKTIVNKLKEDDCGSIGFAGTPYKSSLLTSPGWGALEYHAIVKMNLIQHFKHEDGKAPQKVYHNPDDIDFSQVIALDGLCIFVRKSVWAECRFDNKIFTGFHYYDIDFSMSTSLNYNNYVCNIVTLEHLSEGTPSAEWEAATILCQKKWNNKLPLMTADFRAKYGKDRAALAKLEYCNLKNAIKASHPFFNLKKECVFFCLRNKWTLYTWKLILNCILYRGIIKEKQVYLFHFIPIITIAYFPHKKSYRLFRILPIWRSSI